MEKLKFHLKNQLNYWKNKHFFGLLIIFVLIISCAKLILAAGGGGTCLVDLTTADGGETGQTFNFIYTADASKDSGAVTLEVPAGWSAPQGSAGVAGYTSVSTTGILGNEITNADTTANWAGTNHMDLSANTSDYQEGAASLSNNISSYAQADENWYYNYGAASNWGTNNTSTNERVGFFIKSSVATAAGNLYWQDDDSASLASPLDTISLDALGADTWTYMSATLSADTRASILSYGLRYSTDIGAATIQIDSMAPLFDACEAATNWSSDSHISRARVASGKEGSYFMRCTYADTAGIGTSGECYRSGTARIIGPGTTVSFWVRSSVALNAGDFAWVDDDSTSLRSPLDTVNLPALAANTWAYVTLTASNSANLSARSWGLRQVVDKGALTIDLDAIGKQVDAADSASGWTAPTASCQTIASSSAIKKEGSASLLNTVAASAKAGDKWYKNLPSAQNWSSYTTVGFWIRSSVAASAGNLQFEYDDSASLASPIGTLNIGALAANTWTWQKLALSGTRVNINSYGIKYTADIGAASIYFDYLLAGPGSLTFSGSGPWTISAIPLDLAGGGTVSIAYGAGSGSSGVTVPGSGGIYTFTSKNKDASDGTLINIASSPQIMVSVGDLTADIVDSGGSSVSNPSITMDPIIFSFNNQTNTGIFGKSNQKIRVENNSADHQWNLTLAASDGPTASWDGTAVHYDFNDLTAAAQDGSDADNWGGQMTINPAVGSLIAKSGCNTAGLSLGSASAFSEGVNDNITLITAGIDAGIHCYWDLTGIGISQTIPAEQPADAYDIDLTLTVVAL